MLDRIGGEVTKVRSIVRYPPGSKFESRTHEWGEEIFVVDGVFEDEHGRYPGGAWIRSPHMGMRKPFSQKGCTQLREPWPFVGLVVICRR